MHCPDNVNTGVSIVLITHNRVNLLLDAVESLLAKTVQTPLEIIIVDNGSTDGTAQIVQERYPRVRLISLTKNLGVSGGRDVGIQEAQYELVLFMDDDALLESDCAVDLVSQFFVTNSDVAVLAFSIVNDMTGTILSHEFPKRGHSLCNTEVMQDVAYFVGCGFCLRRSVYQLVGGFCRDMMYGPEEVDLSFRILEAGYRIVYTPDITIRHRTSPQFRRKGVWFRNEMQARVLLAVRNLSFWCGFPFLVFWHTRLFLQALMTGNLRWYLQGVINGWRDCVAAHRQRNPISFRTAIKAWRLGGRLFY